ncbi:MAG: DUF262 domain-containing protein [Candidatus Binataceae bacterium]
MSDANINGGTVPLRTPARERAPAPGYSYRIVTVAEALGHVMSRRWDIPPFQRTFIWSAAQVCDLADSLWRNYPVGPLLLWRDPLDKRPHNRWIADGQHRLTALCLLFGHQPPWWPAPGNPERRFAPIRFYFNPHRRNPFTFGAESDDGIRVDELGALSPAENGSHQLQFERIVRRFRKPGDLNIGLGDINEQLWAVTAMKTRTLAAAVVDHEAIEMLEIFERLNSRGIKFRRLLLKMIRQAAAYRARWLRISGATP